ncbi:MAG: two-component regulator propeller domain-containing protein [Ignavibacteriaceae bacterium]
MNISNLNSRHVFNTKTISHRSFSNLYKIKFKFLLIALQFILSYSFNAIAQDSDIQKKFLHFQHLNVEDGLSQGMIISIFQDSRGFLWFATQYGLNRYDGYSFKIYTNNPLDSVSISNNFVLSIAEDKAGNLWIGTENGLNKFDYSNDIFTRYLQDSTNLAVISSVIVDKEGAIWAGTPSAGLYRLVFNDDKTDSVTITNYHHNPDNVYSLSSNLARCIFEDSKGQLWVGTDKGLNLLVDYKKGIFKRITTVYNENRNIESQIWTICEDESGKLLIGSTAGLYSVFEDLDNSFYLVDFFIRNKNISIPNTVISAYKDKADNLWIGTYAGGLYLWNENNFQLSKVLDRVETNNMQNLSIQSILVDCTNVLWIGTKSGLLKYSPTNSYFDNFGNTKGLNSDENLVLTFLEDKTGKIWIGKNLNLELFDPEKEKSEEFNLGRYITYSPRDLGVKSLYQDNTGTIWIGTLWRGLYEMTKGKGGKGDYKFHQYWFYNNSNPALYDNEVIKIIEDKWGYLWIATKFGVKRFNRINKKFYDLKFTPQSKIKPPETIVYEIYKSPSNPDIIWIGTRSQGMYQVQLGNNENEITGLRHFTPDSKNPHSLSTDFVRTILEDTKGRVWAGTLSSGLDLLNKDSTAFTNFSTKDGLPSEAILGLLEDDFGYLWISTISGLCRFDPESLETINFYKSDGLQSSEFNGGSYLKSKSGELFFGGINGFDIVHPELVQKNKLPPPVVITEIQLYNKSIFNRIQKDNIDTSRSENVFGAIELAYNENVLSFEFSALDYINPANNKYAYMMQRIDTSWNFAGSRRFANYSKIPPGKRTNRGRTKN